jgi:farnesyl-diphosphate farnesyltransferase
MAGHGARSNLRAVTAFALRRPFLILRDLVTSRERPDLERLARVSDPESFVWAILPHAARTFSACIAMMPARSALPSAVAYLYCRMLDTYEDLVPDPATREASLRAFAARLTGADGRPESRRLQPAPPIHAASDRDDRDRAHLLLVRRAELVDTVFLTFDEQTRAVVRDLVRDMAEGMCWSSSTFASQKGVLCDEGQLSAYCRHVLGNPAVFGIRLLKFEHGQSPELSPVEREDAMLVGEMVQLANVTRDIEKDLRRGIAYDAALAGDLGRDVAAQAHAELTERVRAARERMLRFALTRASSYRRIIGAVRLPRWSLGRGSAVLMLLFTERYFRGCARRVGMRVWPGPDSVLTLLRRTFSATFSHRRAFQEMERVEREFLQAATS